MEYLTKSEVQQFGEAITADAHGIGATGHALEGAIKLAEAIRDQALSSAEKYAATADFYGGKFKEYGEAAQKFADRAIDSGNVRAAEVYERYATTFQDVAKERQALGDAAWVKSLAEDARAAQYGVRETVSAAAEFGVRAGAAIEALQMGVSAMEGYRTGNWGALGKVSSGVLASNLASA